MKSLPNCFAELHGATFDIAVAVTGRYDSKVP
jgi:hypothetical protein